MAELPEIQRAVMFVPTGSISIAQGGSSDAVEFDAAVREQHELKSTLTDHPVETGANVTDHSRPEARSVTLEIVQSNTPLDGADGSDRARALWRRFVDLWQNPKLLTLYTARDFYPSMAIESVSSTVDAKTSQALVCTVTFKEIRVVQNKFTRIVPTRDPRGQRKKDQGRRTTALHDIKEVGAGFFRTIRGGG